MSALGRNMAKVKCIPIGGELEYFWNTNDHLPPHFHVKQKGGDWEIRVYLNEYREKKLGYDFKFPSTRAKNIPGKYEAQILKEMKNKMKELFIEWETTVKFSKKG